MTQSGTCLLHRYKDLGSVTRIFIKKPAIIVCGYNLRAEGVETGRSLDSLPSQPSQINEVSFGFCERGCLRVVRCRALEETTWFPTLTALSHTHDPHPHTLQLFLSVIQRPLLSLTRICWVNLLRSWLTFCDAAVKYPAFQLRVSSSLLLLLSYSPANGPWPQRQT